MKKLLLVVAVVALCGVFQNAKAQFSAGLGLNYATEVNTLGISAQVAYDFSDKWAATGAFTYYLEKNNLTWTNIDLNANYVFTEVGKMGKLYGIAGLSYLTSSYDYDKIDVPNVPNDTPDFPTGFAPSSFEAEDNPWEGLGKALGAVDDSTSSVGLNLGIGLKMDLSEKMVLCPELVYTTANTGHIRLGAKLMFKF